MATQLLARDVKSLIADFWEIKADLAGLKVRFERLNSRLSIQDRHVGQVEVEIAALRRELSEGFSRIEDLLKKNNDKAELKS